MLWEWDGSGICQVLPSQDICAAIDRLQVYYSPQELQRWVADHDVVAVQAGIALKFRILRPDFKENFKRLQQNLGGKQIKISQSNFGHHFIAEEADPSFWKAVGHDGIRGEDDRDGRGIQVESCPFDKWTPDPSIFWKNHMTNSRFFMFFFPRNILDKLKHHVKLSMFHPKSRRKSCHIWPRHCPHFASSLMPAPRAGALAVQNVWIPDGVPGPFHRLGREGWPRTGDLLDALPPTRDDQNQELYVLLGSPATSSRVTGRRRRWSATKTLLASRWL